MSDNERIEKLRGDIVTAINDANLPLAVTQLVLENLQYHIAKLTQQNNQEE